MKAVKVQYTVQPEYAAQNRGNFEKVMVALKAKPVEGMHYTTFTDAEDPNTLVHTNIARNDEVMGNLNNQQEFTNFRMALKARGPVSPPKQIKLNLVARRYEV